LKILISMNSNHDKLGQYLHNSDWIKRRYGSQLKYNRSNWSLGISYHKSRRSEVDHFLNKSGLWSGRQAWPLRVYSRAVFGPNVVFDTERNVFFRPLFQINPVPRTWTTPNCEPPPHASWLAQSRASESSKSSPWQEPSVEIGQSRWSTAVLEILRNAHQRDQWMKLLQFLEGQSSNFISRCAGRCEWVANLRAWGTGLSWLWANWRQQIWRTRETLPFPRQFCIIPFIEMELTAIKNFWLFHFPAR
jgi:hypothetical protein